MERIGHNDMLNLAALAMLEEAELLAEGRRRFHVNENPFDLTERQFIKRYRLTPPMVENLTDLLEPYMIHPTRISALGIQRKILTALRFFASGSYQLCIGENIHHAVSQPSVSRAIAEVCDALNQPHIFNKFIRFPRNMNELVRTRTEFYNIHQFPGVVGCIDCTHVAIFPPAINDPVYPEALYVNRKGYHSINVQLICDANLKIINVCARYPGSTHDSFIWNNSNVLPLLQHLHRIGHQSFYLLGDSGYALRPWLMTPFANAAPGSPEAAYNERQMSTRSLIERCNGVLKLRFRCLLKHRVLHYSPRKASQIINACTILHNLCIENNLPEVEWDNEDDIPEELLDFGMYPDNGNPLIEEGEQIINNAVNPDLAAGRRLRLQIMRNHFN